MNKNEKKEILCRLRRTESKCDLILRILSERDPAGRLIESLHATARRLRRTAFRQYRQTIEGRR